MRRIAELIDRNDRHQAVTAIDQLPNVACERAGIAGHRDDDRHAASCDLTRLRLGALPGWIENHGVESAELRGGQWHFEQVAPLSSNGFEARGGGRGALE